MVCCDVVDDMNFRFSRKKTLSNQTVKWVYVLYRQRDNESYSIDRIEIVSMQTVHHLTAAVSMILLLQRFEVIIKEALCFPHRAKISVRLR